MRKIKGALMTKKGAGMKLGALDRKWLKALFDERGYIRVRDPGSQRHGSYEVRFSVVNREEERRVRQILKKMGISAAASYPKHSRTVVPVYGRVEVARIMKEIGARPKGVKPPKA